MRAALVLFSMLMANYLNKGIDCHIERESRRERGGSLLFFTATLCPYCVCACVFVLWRRRAKSIRRKEHLSLSLSLSGVSERETIWSGGLMAGWLVKAPMVTLCVCVCVVLSHTIGPSWPAAAEQGRWSTEPSRCVSE